MRKTVVRSGLGINAFFVLLRINQALVKGREVEKETLGGEGEKKWRGQKTMKALSQDRNTTMKTNRDL